MGNRIKSFLHIEKYNLMVNSLQPYTTSHLELAQLARLRAEVVGRERIKPHCLGEIGE